MQILFSSFKSICLLFLTVLAVMMVNKQFIFFMGISTPEQPVSGLFLQQWQWYIFYVAVAGAISWTLCSKWFVWKFMKVKVSSSLTEQPAIQIYSLLKQLSEKQNIKQPQLAIYESSDINAFTTGFSQQHAIIVVSSGLLHSLNHDEQEAVLAHELTHIANHDMLTLSLMQGVINVLVMLPSHCAGWLIDKNILRRNSIHGPAYYITWFCLQASMGFVATMLVMWFSRWREFRADKGAADLVGSVSMQAALSCLKAGRDHDELPDELGSFGISGHIGKGVKRLFASHPPLNERIVALREDWH